MVADPPEDHGFGRQVSIHLVWTAGLLWTQSHQRPDPTPHIHIPCLFHACALLLSTCVRHMYSKANGHINFKKNITRFCVPCSVLTK